MKVLHFILYNKLFPPRNGGMLRCWNIMEQISKYYEVDVVTSQNDIVDQINESELIFPDTTRFLNLSKHYTNSSGLKNYTIINKFWTAIKYRKSFLTFSSADSSLLEILPVISSISGNQYDFVIFEHIESLRLWRKIKFIFPSAKIILDAHNIDHILLCDMKDKKRLRKIKKTESSLYKICDLVLASSIQDAATFKTINKKEIRVVVVPNGVNIDLNSYQLPDFRKVQKKLIFCGSLDYEPNQLGLTWFLDNVWQEVVKKYPGIILSVVGRGQPGETLLNLLKQLPDIDFIGEVDEVIPYYREAQCAIVPILHGSGTRLKILEAMSLGVPVISTFKGAEGIHYQNGENIFICNEPNEYLNIIDRLYDNDVSFISTSKNARELVAKEYSWNVIGKSLQIYLEKLVSDSKTSECSVYKK